VSLTTHNGCHFKDRQIHGDNHAPDNASQENHHHRL